MTKRVFNAFAALVRADVERALTRPIPTLGGTLAAARYAAETFATVATRENPRFDYDRFMRACGLRAKE